MLWIRTLNFNKLQFKLLFFPAWNQPDTKRAWSESGTSDTGIRFIRSGMDSTDGSDLPIATFTSEADPVSQTFRFSGTKKWLDGEKQSQGILKGEVSL